MDILSVEEATLRFYSALTDVTGWKFLKSRRCLKKDVGSLSFEIQFSTSKWNGSYKNVEINAVFRLINKDYGTLPVNNVVAYYAYHPELYGADGGYWYDISTDESLSASIDDISKRIRGTALWLCSEFEKDRVNAVKLLFEHFDEYSVSLDFVSDILGMEHIRQKARQIYAGLSDDMKKQAEDYRNGIRNKTWMLNRSNLRFIIDNDLA
ncbi:MAG: hypothetical protein ILP19_08245 [Oscillospiraceae bacterium]|nr:hypothetical protein [Oscillospiraceae bacterium]